MLTSYGYVCSLNVRMVKIVHEKLKMYQIVRMLTKLKRQIKLASLKQSKLNQHDLNDDNSVFANAHHILHNIVLIASLSLSLSLSAMQALQSSSLRASPPNPLRTPSNRQSHQITNARPTTRRSFISASASVSAPKRETDPKKRVVITGMGLVSVFGNDVDAYYEKLLSGESGISLIDRFDASKFPTRFGGQIRGFSSEGYIDGKNERRLDDSEYLGGAVNCDAHHMTDPRADGLGVSSCIESCLEDAGVSPEEVNYINAHATSTLAGDLAEINAIKKVFKSTSGIKINATKSMIGHCLGAAGGLEAIATVKAINTGWLHPSINQFNPEPAVDFDTVANEKKQHEVNVAISNSFGFGGHNSVVAFSAFKP
ncbi:hypothetical protein BRARA_F03628 [Brassica rapa]|uniref:beta-ketoacyl-[acyl-carrier-protein] synthase I n=1 Tax=Brassica campestris TaxID=3711 RepID=A0A397Z8C1_BRACM|nr:hypothetical protein BRARA_F03628 [Brassica rapa]